MIPHHVVFIHGIGDKCDGFSFWLQERSRREFNKTVYRLTAETPPHDGIQFREALWYEHTQRDQDILWDRIFPWMPTRNIRKIDLPRNPGNWRFRLKYLSFIRKLVVNLQGDVIAYIQSPGADKYDRIHQCVYREFERCTERTLTTDATANNPAFITVVGHSLGAVIASDLLYDVLEKNTAWWPPQLCLANLISLGSPLALYALRYRSGRNSFQMPVAMRAPDELWVNVYDPQDVIGYPLKSLNEAYGTAVFADKEINAGQWWNPWHLLLQSTPFVHFLYLKDNTVAAMIGRKAALDWLQSNRPDMKAILTQEYVGYRKWLLGTHRPT